MKCHAEQFELDNAIESVCCDAKVTHCDAASLSLEDVIGEIINRREEREDYPFEPGWA